MSVGGVISGALGKITFNTKHPVMKVGTSRRYRGLKKLALYSWLLRSPPTFLIYFVIFPLEGKIPPNHDPQIYWRKWIFFTGEVGNFCEIAIFRRKYGILCCL